MGKKEQKMLKIEQNPTKIDVQPSTNDIYFAQKWLNLSKKHCFCTKIDQNWSKLVEIGRK